MIHENLLRHAGARFLWWALALLAGSIALYSTQRSTAPPNGGTWQGYVLGSVGLALILWLVLLGVRKRSYQSRLGSVRAWTSAHVYLGTALLGIATLHCAAQIGWNVHTLAYVLLWIVVLSGIFGAYTYLAYPRQLSRNREGGARSQLFAELLELDQQSRRIAARCNPDVGVAIVSAVERTVIGGGVAAQLLAADRSFFVAGSAAAPSPNADQQPVIDFLAHRLPRATKRSEAALLQEAVVLLSRRQAVIRRIRRDIRMQGLLTVWLYLHAPLSIALLVALAVHILATYLYW